MHDGDDWDRDPGDVVDQDTEKSSGDASVVASGVLGETSRTLMLTLPAGAF